jgi:3-oxoacyl-[acyl-carrier protein] reductase
MDLGLKGKKALCCAASRGLGFGAAMSLALEGAEVFLSARGDESLQRAAQEIEAACGRRPACSTADMAVAADRQTLFAAAENDLGPLDILIVNAGGPPPGPFESHGPENWQLAIDLALGSVTHLCGLALPGMKARGFGRIVQIVSVAGLEHIEGLILSNASRPAVLGFAKALARELGDSGVLINSVCPGIFLTDRIRELSEARAAKAGISPEQYMEQLGADVPLGRAGDPRELGDLVAFLASERNGYVQGSAIVIDGGRTKRLY